MAGIGLLQGLAVNAQNDQQIDDLRRRRADDMRAEQSAMAKAALFAEDTDFNNAINEHDAPIVREYAKNQLRKIGEYYRNNPDVMYNPEKLTELRMMKKSLKDNPDLIRGISSDTAYKQYLADLQEVAKNPNMHDSEAYEDYQRQWDNYRRFGNQEGEEAAMKEGKKAFLYSKPQDFVDLPTTLSKAGTSIKDYNIVKGKTPGEYWTQPKGDQVQALKNSIYQQHGRQIQVTARKLGLTTPEQIDQWVTKNIEAGFDKHYQLGDPLALRKLAISEGHLANENRKLAMEGQAVPQTSTWDDLMNPKNTAGAVNQKVVKEVWGENPKAIIYGTNGTKADLTGLTWKSDGRFVKPTEGRFKGVPFLSGYIDVPIEVAKEKGIVKEGFAWMDDEVAPGFGNRATIEKVEKDGKTHQYVRILHEIPVDPSDQTAKSMYELQTMPSKLVETSVNRFQSQVPSASMQEWLNNGWTEEQVKQAAQQGKINVR